MNMLKTLFNRRLRGFRVVEVVACGCLAVLVLSVYLTKASAGREAASIAGINKDIEGEQKRLRLLKAELAHLEQPQRLERLSTQYLALAPVPAKRETVPDGLTEVARHANSSVSASAAVAQ
jgi:hypothetical protein